MEPLSYLDFELKIEREGDRYTASVIHSPAGEASCAFALPFSEEKLELLVLKIGRLRTSTRRIYSAEMEAARELGGKLFEAVFGGEVRACLRSSLSAIEREGTGLRLKLRLQDAPELADLPWEFLFDPSHDRFLAHSIQTPIVRYIELPERIRPLAVKLPLHLLVMISSPTDHVRLDVEREKAVLRTALDPLSEEGKVQVDWLEKASLAALQQRLCQREYHVFHFIGHGGFDTKTEEGVLVLEDEQGRGRLAGAPRIGTLLHDHRSLRLAVLNSCEGARNTRTDPFAGVATTAVRQGIPAVVAMQFEITDAAAITFAAEFYKALAESFPVDAAMAEARKAIYTQPNDVEWGTPVLYTRAPDGRLFAVDQVPAAEPVPIAEKPSAPVAAVRGHRSNKVWIIGALLAFLTGGGLIWRYQIMPLGNNAWEKVPAPRPDHPRSVNQYVDLARRAVADGRWDKAQTYLQQAVAIAPGDEKVAQAQKELNEKKAEAERQEEELRQLLAGAEDDLNSGRLTTPEGHNAWEKYLRIQELQPDQPQAKQGIRNIVYEYIQRARTAMSDDKRLAEAWDYLEKADRILPNDERLPMARTELRAAEQKLRLATEEAKRQAVEEAKGKAEAERQSHEEETKRKMNEFLELARQAIAREQWDGAQEHLVQAAKILPGDKNVIQVQKELDDNRDEAKREREKVDKYLGLALQAIENKRWDTAQDYINQAAAILPEYGRVSSIRKTLRARQEVDEWLDLAGQAIAREEGDKAQRYLNKAKRLLPGDEGVARMQKILDDRARESLRTRLRQAAEQGNAGAQYDLGRRYDHGKGERQDRAEAARWYRSAAEQGHIGAQYNLGKMYEKGEGVPGDDRKACYWYSRAGDQEDTQAQWAYRELKCGQRSK